MTTPRAGDAVRVENLHKRYKHTVAVDDVSFSVAEGEIVGILGPNGAGKTTTVETITGLRRPDTGSVRVFGLDPVRDHDRLVQTVGVQLQSSRLPEKLRVEEAIRLYASFYDQPADGDELLTRLGLDGQRRTRFGKLSGGQQQRLAIALALIGRPRLAVLDELTTGLDPHARRETWRLIQELRGDGVTVLLVTHFMEEAEFLCDRIVLIDGGRAASAGTPRELTDHLEPDSQRLRFRVDGDFDETVLHDLPGVGSVTRTGDRIDVTGRADVVLSVTGALARNHVVAHDLRVTETRLDDAYETLAGSTSNGGR